MAERRRWHGKTTQWLEPNWQPLLDLIGEDLTGCFMWMHEAELSNGTRVHAYKHIDTRRYIHLADDGAAFVYEYPDQYRRLPAAKVLAAVFAPLPGLAGVTDAQVEASWAAVERLRSEASRPG